MSFLKRLSLGLIMVCVCLDNPLMKSTCEAQFEDAIRLFINLGSDLAEAFYRLPTSKFFRELNPVIQSVQNLIASDKPILKTPMNNIRSSNGERILLYNDRKRLRFLVYNNRRKPENFFELDLERPGRIPFFRIRSDSQLKILVHGFKGSSSSRFPQHMKNEYLASTNHDVLVVDWSDLSTPAARNERASNALYFAVTDNVPRAGLRVYELLEFLLHNQIISDLRQIHFVGHSLGAHVASKAAKFIQQRYGRSVGRLSGLDPAAPLFRSEATDRRLTSTDAELVDVVHTSIAGLFQPIGHVDFYPNGGQIQPQCIPLRNQNSTNNVQFFACNHLSAYEFFSKSIRQGLVACECNSYQDFRSTCGATCQNTAIFGEHVSPRSRGRFFLDMSI